MEKVLDTLAKSWLVIVLILVISIFSFIIYQMPSFGAVLVIILFNFFFCRKA
jgi:hypothetical protein